MHRTVLSWALFLALAVSSPLSAAEEIFPFLGEVTGNKVNVRAGQSLNFERLCELKQGDQVVVLEKAFNWYKVRLPAQAEIYVSSKFVKNLDEEVGEITGNRVNIRAGAGDKYSVISQLSKGQLVRIVEVKDGWCRIQPVEDTYGWISQEFLAFRSKEVPPPMKIDAPIKNVYVKKRVEAAAPVEATAPAVAAPALPPTSVFYSSGTVQTLGERAIARDIRHSLAAEGGANCYLQAEPPIVDTFMQYKVKIEGQMQPDIKAPHPVISVTKISLIL